MRHLCLFASKSVSMGSNLPKYRLFTALLLLFVACVARGAESLPADTVMVFRKMAADSAVIVKKQSKRAAPKKKKAAARKVAKKPAPKAKAVNKIDSVKYVPPKYYLGDRVLMRGDSGADVKKLAEIMVKNLYMDENSVPYTVTGEVLYDKELLRAVKLFQKVSGLYEDGIVGETTIKALRKIHRWRRMNNNK